MLQLSPHGIRPGRARTPTAPGRRVERWILGNQPWGTFRCFGSMRGPWARELTVYPPGATVRQRWALGLDRMAPIVGAAIGLGATVSTWELLPGWTAPVLVLLPALLAAFVIHRVTRGLRRGVRSLTVVEDYRADPAVVSGDAALFDECHEALSALDADAALLSPVEYERRWGEVYSRLPE